MGDRESALEQHQLSSIPVDQVLGSALMEMKTVYRTSHEGWDCKITCLHHIQTYIDHPVRFADWKEENVLLGSGRKASER